MRLGVQPPQPMNMIGKRSRPLIDKFANHSESRSWQIKDPRGKPITQYPKAKQVSVGGCPKTIVIDP